MNRRYFDRVSGPTQLTLAGSERDRQLLSVVVPCANEHEVIRETNARLVASSGTPPHAFRNHLCG